MEAFFGPVRSDDNFNEIKKAIEDKKTPVNVWGITRGARPLIMEALRGDSKFAVLVTYDDSRAEKLYSDYRFYDKNVYIYPAKDALFYYADVHGNATTQRRLEIIRRLNEKKDTVIITTVDGLMDKMPRMEEITGGGMSFTVGEEINI